MSKELGQVYRVFEAIRQLQASLKEWNKDCVLESIQLDDGHGGKVVDQIFREIQRLTTQKPSVPDDLAGKYCISGVEIKLSRRPRDRPELINVMGSDR